MNQNQTFFDYFRGLNLAEKRLLRKQIIQACGVETVTFYTWLQRNNIPSQFNRTTIALILGKKELDLFPDTAIINQLN